MSKRLILLSFLLIFFTVSCERDPYTEEKFSWKSSSPARQNMQAGYLDSALNEAQLEGYIDALLVIRNGSIVAEAYYNGYTKTTTHNVKSVSKSFLSAITGLALDRGYIASLDEKMIDYFPEYHHLQMDQRVNEVTIRHLLTMRMGIKGESDDEYGVYQGLYTAQDWIKATLESDFIFDPGARMRYNTFQTHLLSVIVSKATDQSSYDFANEVLLEPMGIDVDGWEQDPQGYHFGGNSMHFTPREMAVLGYLYLNKGSIDDTQIIPESWIARTLSASTNFAHPNEWGAWKNYNYAWLWWLGQINNHSMYMAYGYGGQYVVVFPELELIIVTTAQSEVHPDTSNIQELAIFDIISDHILPSIID